MQGLKDYKLPDGLTLAFCAGTGENDCEPWNKGMSAKTINSDRTSQRKAQRELTQEPAARVFKKEPAKGQKAIDFKKVALAGKREDKVAELKIARARLREIEKKHPAVGGNVRGPADVAKENVNRLRREKADLDKELKEYDARKEFEEANPLASPSEAAKGIAEILAREPIISIKQTGGGHVCTCIRCNLEGGSVGFFKPDSGAYDGFSSEGLEAHTLGDREVAAFELDGVMEFGLVMPTTIRDDGPEDTSGDVGRGSMQLGVTDGVEPAQMTYSQRSGWINNPANNEDAAKFMALDYLMANRDRHDNNFMIDKGGDSDGKLRVIDSGFAFPNEGQSQLRENLILDSVSKLDFSVDAIEKGVTNLIKNHDKVESMLEGHQVTSEQRDAFWGRVNNLKATLKEGSDDVVELMRNSMSRGAL